MIGTINITCDKKEAERGLIEVIERSPGVQVYVEDMDVGDYLIGDRTILDRKTAAEFVAASVNRKLFTEIALMKERFDQVVMLIEGDPFGTRSFVEAESLVEALAWLTILSGVQTVISNTPEHSAHLVATMARYRQHGLGHQQPLRHSAPPPAPAVLTRYVLEGLPGVTANTASILAKRFGSLRKLASANLEEIQDTHGIGMGLGLKVFNAMRAGEDNDRD